MIVSEKNQKSNRQNAQHSTGPKTPEGKAAIRFNALTYGLRTRATILERENAADYSQLWDELEAEWQPQNRTERCYLETLVTSQWLLARIADSERRVYEFIEFGEKQFVMLGYVSKQRAQLERSFRTAIEDMKRSQKERRQQHARQPQPVKAKPAARAQSPVQHSGYEMSEGAEDHPAFCSPSPPTLVSNLPPWSLTTGQTTPTDPQLVSPRQPGNTTPAPSPQPLAGVYSEHPGC